MANDLTTPAAPPASPLKMPSLPASVLRLTTARGRSRFSPDGEFLGSVEEWKAPTSITPSDLNDCRTALMQLEQALEPATPHLVGARVVTLLRHYYLPTPAQNGDQAAAIQRAVAHDWHDAVGEFPAGALEEACRRWVQRETRRPTPADIRAECQRLCADQLKVRDRLRLIVRPTTPPANTNGPGLPQLRRLKDA